VPMRNSPRLEGIGAQLSLHLTRLLARRAVGELPGEDAIAWAASALADGIDTPTVRILAGLNPDLDRADIASYFGRALHELELDGKYQDPAKAYAVELAQRIVDGTIDPIVACKEIYDVVYVPFGLPGHLAYWSCLAGGHSPDAGGELSPDDLRERILEEARALLAKGADPEFILFPKRPRAAEQTSKRSLFSRVLNSLWRYVGAG